MGIISLSYRNKSVQRAQEDKDKIHFCDRSHNVIFIGSNKNCKITKNALLKVGVREVDVDNFLKRKLPKRNSIPNFDEFAHEQARIKMAKNCYLWRFPMDYLQNNKSEENVFKLLAFDEADVIVR